jgi:hypothetical protein
VSVWFNTYPSRVVPPTISISNRQDYIDHWKTFFRARIGKTTTKVVELEDSFQFDTNIEC